MSRTFLNAASPLSSLGIEKLEPESSVRTKAEQASEDAAKDAAAKDAAAKDAAAKKSVSESDAMVKKLRAEEQAARDQSEKLKAEAHAATKTSEAAVKASEASAEKLKAEAHAATKASEASAEKLKAETRFVKSQHAIHGARAFGLFAFLFAGGYSVRFVSFWHSFESISIGFVFACSTMLMRTKITMRRWFTRNW
jgi:hypothetical protein